VEEGEDEQNRRADWVGAENVKRLKLLG